jgi:hypothetical protein
MSSPVVFYAWQNDRPRETCRDFIHEAAAEAIHRVGCDMRIEDSPRLDHDTKNEAGSPPIAETILRKIRQSAVIIADMTYCSEIREEGPNGKVRKKNPNPNVMLELGYAAATMGWNRVILVMNEKYGGPSWLPFDLKNHRFPITYELGPQSTKRSETKVSLILALEQQIRSCLAAEYDLVNATLARLPSHARLMMKRHGPSDVFYEQSFNEDAVSENRVVTMMDMSIAIMLELNVIQCVEAYTKLKMGYAFTYLGKQCCYRLGIFDKPVILPSEPQISPMQVIVDNSYLDILNKNAPKQEQQDAQKTEPTANEAIE